MKLSLRRTLVLLSFTELRLTTRTEERIIKVFVFIVQNFLKIAFRNLLRSKGFSAINILGLAIGMASAILILLWIQNEVSYDQFHAKKDRIYEAWNRASFSGELKCW